MLTDNEKKGLTIIFGLLLALLNKISASDAANDDLATAMGYLGISPSMLVKAAQVVNKPAQETFDILNAKELANGHQGSH